jgi:hypothetical protein
LEGIALEDSAMRRRNTKVMISRKKRVEVRVIVIPKCSDGSRLTQSRWTGICRNNYLPTCEAEAEKIK